MGKIKAVFNWSGGKDSAHALLRILQTGEYDIVALLTLFDQDSHRSTVHGIPLPLLHAQAEHIGIPLHVIELKPEGNMVNDAESMRLATEHFKPQGVTHFIFGDIALHDVRTYRRQRLAPYGIEVVEPLWDQSSETIMETFLTSGLKSVVVTTMADRLDASAIGRTVDRAFIDALPAGVDPNGENGEYHTFCHAGPIFRTPVPYQLGAPTFKSYEIRLSDGTRQTFSYWNADLTTR